MDDFKWGIIGPGNIADSFIDDMQYCKSAKHRTVAVLHHSMEKAKIFGQKHGIANCFDNIESFLASARIDAVYIATPHTLHHAQTMACLKNKIPVLCEKPLGINQQQVEEMIKAATDNETFLMEGMWVRFLPSLTKVSALIDEGVIGKITSVKAALSFKAPYDEKNRYFNPELGGGSLLDLGIYPIFLATHLFGRPTAIKAIAQLTDQNIDEDCKVLCNYKNGESSAIESSLIIKTENQAIIFGEKGTVIIPEPWNEKPPEIIVELKDGKKTTYPCEWKGEGFHFEMDEVYNCISLHRIESEKMNFKLSLDMVEIMDNIREQTGIEYPQEA